MSSSNIRPSESVIAANVPLGDRVSFSPFLMWSFKQVKEDALENDGSFTSSVLLVVFPLRHIILETEDSVEKAAGTTLERIAPTIDLFLSTESLYAEITASSPIVTAQ